MPGVDRYRNGSGFEVFQMKRFLGLLLTGMAASGVALPPASAGEPSPRAVLELFTSQGCSSCPPADALMNRMAADKTLLALTFPVDYWDYLGWKDTFARPEFSARQKSYAEVRGDRKIYTPQIVINGRDHAVGSDEAAINRTIAAHADRFGSETVELELTASADTLTARIGEARGPVTGKATLWLVAYDHAQSVRIGRGENKGRSVIYSNVVRQFQPIGMWKGKPKIIELPRHDANRPAEAGLAIILQANEADGRPGPILGAAVLTGPGS